MISHATASTFVYDRHIRSVDEVRVLLLWHRKFSRWMIPGGHVEQHETCAHAAMREVREETGLDVVLLQRPEAGCSRLAWAVVRQHIAARPAEPAHIHIDHLYVGRRVHEHAMPRGAEWVAVSELGSREMFDGTRKLALAFAHDLPVAQR